MLKLRSVSLRWEIRDCWLGCYWTKAAGGLRLYVCLLPCLPIVLVLEEPS